MTKTAGTVQLHQATLSLLRSDPTLSSSINRRIPCIASDKDTLWMQKEDATEYQFFPNVGGGRHIETFRPTSVSSDQVTIAAAAASGVTVWFPPGTWTLSSQIAFATGTQFIGSGLTSKIVFSQGIENPIVFGHVQNCRIENMRIEGSRTAVLPPGLSYSSGILNFNSGSLAGPTNIVIKDVYLYCVGNPSTSGVDIGGIYFTGTGASAASYITFENVTTEMTRIDANKSERSFHVWMPSRDLTKKKWNIGTNALNQTAWTTDFPVAASADLSVYWQGKLMTITTDYTLSGLGGNTTVTFVSAPHKNYSIGGTPNGSGDAVLLVWNKGPMFQKIDVVGHTAITFTNCKFLGGWQGVYVDADDFTMENCRSDGVDGPIGVAFGKDIKITDCGIYDFLSNGITMGSGQNQIIDGYLIQGCTLRSERSSLHGINVYQQGGDDGGFGGPNFGLSKRGVIAGNRLIGINLYGIFMYGNGFATITGNYCNSSTGIAATGHDAGGGVVHPGHLQITGNVCEVRGGGITAGVSGMAGISNIHIEDNHIFAQDGYVLTTGLYLSQITNSAVKNNSIKDVNGYVEAATASMSVTGGVVPGAPVITSVSTAVATITLQTAPVTGNQFTGVVNGWPYTAVPFNTSAQQTMIDLVANFNLNPATSASTTTCVLTGTGSQPVLTQITTNKYTIVLGSSPVAGNIFSGSIVDTLYSVPYAIGASETFSALVAAITAISGVSSVTSNFGTLTITVNVASASGPLVIKIAAAQYTGIGISVNYADKLVIEGNSVSSIFPCANVWTQLSTGQRMYVRNNYFPSGTIKRVIGGTVAPSLSGNYGGGTTMGDEVHTPTAAVGVSTTSPGTATVALKISSIGSNVSGVVEVVYSAGIVASSVDTNHTACVAYVPFMLSYTGNSVTFGTPQYVSQFNGATVVAETYVAGSFNLVFHGVAGSVLATQGIISAQLLTSNAQGYVKNYQ